jgi:Icc-related predicted phosphoesterase
MAVKTRLFIISDTHADDWQPKATNLPHIDVAIHCGDLTEGSKIHEFRTSLAMLQNINASLKLVIAGNHDFSLDTPLFKKKISEASLRIEPELLKREFGDIGEAQKLFEDAASSGIHFLDEGTHQFNLQNGATLTVYASPYTPSLGEWGFQFNPKHGHEFAIEKGVDIVITHGPPRGVLDMTDSKQRGGCDKLFKAVALSRPLVHCFGHIHEGWGSKLVTWREGVPDKNSSFFSAIDNGHSSTIETLSSLQGGRFDTIDIKAAKEMKLQKYISDGYCRTSHCAGDDKPIQKGKQTLFVNAAIEGLEENTMQLPWIIEIELPKSGLMDKEQ